MFYFIKIIHLSYKIQASFKALCHNCFSFDLMFKDVKVVFKTPLTKLTLLVIYAIQTRWFPTREMIAKDPKQNH